MKDITEVLKQEPVYLNDWSTRGEVESDFEVDLGGEINILFASYGTGNYSGDAFVLFERDGKLFEVNGSHCSCYGLEGQFDEEETTIEALQHRLIEGRMGQDDYSGNDFSEELKQFLGIA